LSGLTPGTTYHYRLVAQNRAGTTYGYDYTFTTPSVPVPLNTVAPTLAGSAALGQKLTVGTGTWNPAASKYAYQWQRSSDGGSSWTNISSATFNTYTLTAADRGGVVRAQIVATNTYGSANVYSAQTGTVASGAPVSSGAPAVSGLAAEGQKLTATTGTWSPAGTSYAYQWQRSSDGGNTWTSIPSAVYSYYTPGAADLGDTVQVRVTATNTYGTTVAYSASTATVASGAPARSASPAVSGLAAEGQKLTATAGTWAPAGTSYAYQWQRSSDGGNTWTNIPSATLSYYTLGAADLGDTVQVQVTATNTWGTATASSASTATVASGAPVSTVKPAITGSAGAGQKLTATAGTWNPAGTSYAYQWQYSSDGGNTWTNIAAATSYSYTLTTTYVGDTLQVRVTATNTWGTTTASSPSTATVASGAPVSTVAPKISGTMVVGQRLSAGSGTWAPAASTYTYQWQRSATSDPSGTWTNITGATSSAYALTAADNGNYVRVTVTAKNTYGSATAESAVSNQVT
jgi:hypothetical protein